MRESLRERLERRGVLLLDSAMGTMLQRVGLGGGECGELWNIGSESDHVLEIHRANLAAGSEVLIANTFGANRIKLGAYGLAGRARELGRAGAALARRAAGDRALVAGDMGPTGAILEEWGGSASRAELIAAFREQAEGLVAGGVDLFALETFMDLEELKCALEGVRAVSALPVLASLTFAGSPTGMRTLWGLAPAEAARALEAAGVDLVGANCGMGSRQMLEVTAELAGATSLPVAAQPNAGAPRVEDGRTIYPESPAEMAALAGEFRAAGVRLIGGCCGTTPEHIAAIGKALAAQEQAV